MSISVFLFARRESELSISHETYRDTESFAAETEILRGGFSFTAASYNADAYCTNEGEQTVDNEGEPNEITRGCPGGGNQVSWREAMRAFVASGGKWDIVGLQEVGILSRAGSDVWHFRDFMRADHGIEYNCIAHPKATEGNINAFCSIFPFVENSIVTIPNDRHPHLNGYVDCVKINTPAGEIVFCNAHPGYQAAVELYQRMEPWILTEVINAYIPPTLTGDEREIYRKSLLARTILVGDMNARLSQIVGKFKSTCPNSDATPDHMSAIDHVMIPDLSRADVSGAQPFHVDFLTYPPTGCKTMEHRWPTDHGGPVVATFTTRSIILGANGLVSPTNAASTPTPTTNNQQPTTPLTPSPTANNQQPTNTLAPIATPKPSPSPTPTITPTPVRSATLTPTVVPTLSPTVTPSPTPTPSATPTPTATYTPSPTPTSTHTPTPSPFTRIEITATPAMNLSVNGQSPGMAPVTVLFISVGLVILGFMM